ncbi:hypothetical protein H8B09_21530 [Paenibacillus sp. PR3]|uniref:DUF5808 domain-containing protein n=1 Tax=Paenibacillus terricola TaxID=2763503 RepID=A0ABR8MZI8_9BACL|nr:hypothetical protein [Paenibacillus terricola]
MYTAILLGTIILCYIVMLAVYWPQARYAKGMLFAITLPEHVMDDSNIQSIQLRFKKRFVQVSLWMTLLLIPFIVSYNWIAYQTLYYFAWLTAFFIVMAVPFRRAFRETLALKREKEWFVGKKRVITTDLRAAYLKNKHMAPAWLFAIPFALSIGLMLWGMRMDASMLSVTLSGLFITALLWFISIQARRVKSKVYSANSEVNVSLNQANRRSLSYLWLTVAVIENVHFLVLAMLVHADDSASFGVWLTMSILLAAIPILWIWQVYRTISERERELLALDDKPIYTDDDEYWANGFTYHNPMDRSVMVEKRVGIGMTINTGTTAGKIMMWGMFGLIFAVIAGACFIVVRAEFTAPSLVVTAEHRVKIDYPMYSYSFNADDIKQMTLIERVPSGMKTEGEATNKYARGHFSLKELGKTRLYIFKNNPPYIQIKLADGYIIYNDKDPMVTERLYEEIRQQLPASE